MKKIYIIAMSIIMVLIVILSFTIYTYKGVSFNGEEKIYGIKTHYTYNVINGNNVEVLCYSNNPKSYLKEYIDVTASFKCSSTSDQIKANINNVKLVDVYKYNNEVMYAYKLYVKPININSVMNIPNCILETRDFSLKIGSLSLVNYVDTDSVIDYSKIYVIGNDHLGFKSINGIVINFTNTTDDDYYINDIQLGKYNYCSLNDAKVLDSDINYGDDIKLHIPSYNPLKFNTQSKSIKIPSESTVRLLIPVYYESKAFLGKTPIFINKECYIDNYNFLTNYEDLNQYEDILIEAEFNFI